MKTHDTKGCPKVRTDLERIINTLEAGRVTRYHAAPTVAPQTNGLHQWGVLMIAIYITEGKLSPALLLECAGHDLGEYFSGDMPFTAKRDNPELKRVMDSVEDTARKTELLISAKELTPREHAILKLADTLDGLIWCWKTETRGPVRERWIASFAKGLQKFSTVLSFKEMKRATNLFEVYAQ